MPPRILLFCVTPLENESLFRKAYSRIDSYRQKRVDRYAKEEDKRLALGAGLLLSFLRKKEGIEAPLVYNEHGKAYFEGNPLYFNLSHSGSYVALAYDKLDLGVDIEAHREVDEGIFPKVFTPAEQALLHQKEGEAKKAMFFRLWTEKESYLKAVGVGLSKPLSSVDFSAHAGQDAFLHQDEDAALSFSCLSAPRGYSLCLAAVNGAAPEVKELTLGDILPTTMKVNENAYRILSFLGKGKGGHSFLAERNGTKVVVKCIHHDPCDYYTFGDKLESERRDYARLMGVGIPMPALIEVDEKKERIVKEFIDGQDIQKDIREGKDVSKAMGILESWLPKLYEEGLNIDYYPTNFVFSGGSLDYIDYECNEYHEEWDFEHWGRKTWEEAK